VADSPVDDLGRRFAAELRRLRARRGWTQKQLAAEMGFHPSYVSHVEAGRHPPTEDFAQRADHCLGAAGAVWRLFDEFHRAHGHDLRPPAPLPSLPMARPPLVVKRDEIEYRLDGGRYVVHTRLRLHNSGTDPITHVTAQVEGNRYAEDPEAARRFYSLQPLSWDELDFHAACGRQPLDWDPVTDRDSFKEVRLLFKNPQGRFPLQPGQERDVQYRYVLPESKAGHQVQRSVRMYTHELVMSAVFPVGWDPGWVWAVEDSMYAADRAHVWTRQVTPAGVTYSVRIISPPLIAAYRLEWPALGRRGDLGAGIGA
jgi:transcriptional regulator with XRE-family HTH domain